MEKLINLIDFRGVKSSIFTGRPQGLQVRNSLNLSDIDKDNTKTITFEIPNGTTSLNPSFYLGLLFDSYKNLGVDRFNNKYKFKISTPDPEIRRVLQKNLDDAVRSAINSLNNKNAISSL